MLSNTRSQTTIALLPDVASLSTGRFAFLTVGTLFVLATVGASAIGLFIAQ